MSIYHVCTHTVNGTVYDKLKKNMPYEIASLFFATMAIFMQMIMFAFSALWQRRKVFALLSTFLLVIAVALLLFTNPKYGLLLVFFASYAIFNLLRIHKGRMVEERLKNVTLRTSRITTVLILLVYSASVAHVYFAIYISLDQYILAIAAASCIVSLIIAIATTINICSTGAHIPSSLSSDELPTITVAIAARNETPTLTACLESVLSSDYPKMEVLVLDDDSQDTTAEIIASFARDGVRFVKSESFNGSWLAKNRAYQTLLIHASGEYIMFMGVDVRMHELSLRSIAEYIVSTDKTMTTLVPKRTKGGFAAALIQPLRYWWELAIPQQFSRRPPALSTSWIIKRKALLSLGGFTAYKKSIIPEMHLSKHFASISEYDFIRTTSDMLLTTHKTLSSQWDTLIRTRYPLLHRRPEEVLMQTGLIFSLVILPFLLFPLGLLGHIEPVSFAFISVSVLLYIYAHVAISIITNPVAAYMAPLNFPIAMVLDIIGMHISMYRYEFSKIIWKGRDVAPRKLVVYDKLPPI